MTAYYKDQPTNPSIQARIFRVHEDGSREWCTPEDWEDRGTTARFYGHNPNCELPKNAQFMGHY